MATLSLARRDVCFDARLALASSLAEWLDGHWGLVFSHPQDFQYLDLEADRWLFTVEDAFARARVRAIAVDSNRPCHRGGWIEQLEAGEDSTLVLERPREASAEWFEPRAKALRSAIAGSKSRFVLMLDESLRLRRTFSYASREGLPSLLDFAATVAQLRAQPRPIDEPPEPLARRPFAQLPVQPAAARIRFLRSYA